MSMPARAASPRASWRPRLQVVRSPERSRSIVPFLSLCAIILVASLVAALLLNTAMAVSSYRVHDQQIRLSELRETEAELETRLESLGSPSTIRHQAESLGMVPAEATVYISVGSRSILGTAAAGEGN